MPKRWTPSGERRHRIEFRRYLPRDNEQYDGRGQLISETDGGQWLTTHATRAKVKQISGGESEAANTVMARSQVLFNVRWFRNLKETDQILFRGKPFGIGRIDNVEFRNREYEILADDVSREGPGYATTEVC